MNSALTFIATLTSSRGSSSTPLPANIPAQLLSKTTASRLHITHRYCLVWPIWSLYSSSSYDRLTRLINRLYRSTRHLPVKDKKEGDYFFLRKYAAASS